MVENDIVLRIRLDTNRQTIRISGPSTFNAKEEIKRLGAAKWLGAEKAWEISSFSGSIDEIRTRLSQFQLEFDEVVFEEEKTVVEITTDQEPTVPKGFSVPELLQAAKSALQAKFSGGALVYGVISSLNTGGSNAFLTLSDPSDRTVSIKCAIWGGVKKIDAQLAPYGMKLESDLEVMFQVEVGLNPKNGNLSLSVNRIIPEYSLSKLLGEREKTNKKLKDEGIFEKNKQLQLPKLPYRFGVLTSVSGTVIHDFMGGLEVARFGFELFWFPVSVQGRDAKRSILKGFETLVRRSDLDAIVLFRGGGSVSDLAVFNDYEIAKAICLSPLPVLSAIGHQEDNCSAQDVSCKFFGVPRDIGKALADIVIDLRSKVEKSSEQIRVSGNTLFEKASRDLEGNVQLLFDRAGRGAERTSERLISLVSRLDLSARQLIVRAEDKIKNFSGLSANTIRFLEQKERELSRLALHVSDASPEVQLKRGFSMVRVRSEERFIKSSKELHDNDEVSIEFADGKRDAKIVGES